MRQLFIMWEKLKNDAKNVYLVRACDCVNKASFSLFSMTSSFIFRKSEKCSAKTNNLIWKLKEWVYFLTYNTGHLDFEEAKTNKLLYFEQIFNLVFQTQESYLVNLSRILVFPFILNLMETLLTYAGHKVRVLRINLDSKTDYQLSQVDHVAIQVT